ncbi:MAG: hypothetical protein ABFD52_07025 [Acidobacteriota bacterium]
MSPRAAAVLALVAALAAALPAGCEDPAAARQFPAEELAQRGRWEAFLSGAAVIESESRQMTGSEAVTSPWVLMLELDGVKHRGLWKNAEGRMGGYWEGWQYEIAAYRLDKLLGLGLVPPTVERRFRDDRGSCQYWVDDCISVRDKEDKGLKIPPRKVLGWNRATYLQRLLDNLIANEDRHMNQILITSDWRMVLIDHSRSFRTSGRFVRSLIYSAKSPEGPRLMSELPRDVVAKVRALDAAAIRAAVGDYLTDEEVRAVIVRRDLVLAEIDRLIEVNGKDKVLY